VSFDAEYRAVLVAVAQHSAQAIDRARLYESAQLARIEAEAANRSKDDFLSIVSHELRTPLTAVLGWASMLRKGSLDTPRVGRAIDAICTNAARQAELIDELLDVSRLVGGRAVFELREIDLRDTLRGVVEAVMPVAEAKGIELRLGAHPTVQITADPRRLEQVFLNLLTNAVKFTPPEGRVTIDAVITGADVEVRVADTGSGIDPAFLPYVFERFRQGSTSEARAPGGLGLGLFIARQLVEGQGGTIRAESQGPGAGATFTVTLPVTQSSPGDSVNARLPRQKASC
jgi:signal transduction histidine kinase